MLLLWTVGLALAAPGDELSLRLREVSASSSVTEAEVRRGVNEALPALAACLRDPDTSLPDVVATLDLRWRVGPVGEARNLMVQGIELAGPELEPCVKEAMRTVQWAGAEAAGARLTARIGVRHAPSHASVRSAELFPPPSHPTTTYLGQGRSPILLSVRPVSEQADPGQSSAIALRPLVVRPPTIEVRLMGTYLTSTPRLPASAEAQARQLEHLRACYAPHIAEGPLRVRLVGRVDQDDEVIWGRVEKGVRREVARCAQEAFSAEGQEWGTLLDFSLDFWPPERRIGA